MKTTNQNTRTINLRTVIYSGILSVAVIASSFAKDALADQQLVEVEDNTLVSSYTSPKNETNKVNKPSIGVDSAQELAEITAPIAVDYTKPIVEVIVENEQIIESTADFDLPIYSGRTIDEVILENEMIIESNKTEDVFPLNLYLINNPSVENRNGIISKNNSEFRS